ncbi:MAG: aldolase/citrate lyase family protein [Desulfurococcales archaeon]|nr:aldolase/citrate lyase family protein [Desulfurococcales archaeon]
MLQVLRDKIYRRGAVYGTWVTIANPEVVEALSHLPFDFLVFDMEHAPLTIRDVEYLMMAVRRDDVVNIVRVPWNDFVIIKQVLDIGAHGVMVPYVNTGDEALAVVRATRYPPKGIRGVGPRRCARYGLMDLREYYERADREILVIAQVETGKAVENIPDIVSVDGIDGVFVGPNDLTASLGIFRDFDNPIYKNALKEIVNTARKAGKIAGIMTSGATDALDKIALGFNFVALSSDMQYLLKGYKEDFRKLGYSS